FWRPELHQRHTGDTIDAARVKLRGAADPVEVHRPLPFQSRPRLSPHAALAHHRTYAVAFQDLGLVGLFADARCRTRGRYLPLRSLLQHNRTAVIEHRAT